MQYILNKPTKYRIQMFALCDSRTFFTGDSEVYCDKQDGPYLVSNKPSDNVNRLTCDAEGTGRNITFDNWYTNYGLTKSLLETEVLALIH
jgi:hypothetical protein